MESDQAWWHLNDIFKVGFTEERFKCVIFLLASIVQMININTLTS